MAAQFHAAGFLVDFVGPADAIITVDNIKCFEESKRIQSEKAVQERVRQASSQINKRLIKSASLSKAQRIDRHRYLKNSQHGWKTLFQRSFGRLLNQVGR
jgi:hypothetical protein